MTKMMLGRVIDHIPSLFFVGHIFVVQKGAFIVDFAIPITVLMKYSTKSHSGYDVFIRREAIAELLLVNSITFHVCKAVYGERLY